MYQINYHHLHLFYWVSKTGSIGGACRKLLLAQPTVSAQIRQFEAALGRKLFERKGRGLSLTEEGRVVLRYAEVIFKTGQELSDDLRDRPPNSALSIQVGMVTGMPRTHIHSMLRCILEAFPDAGISCHEASFEQLLLDLREFRLDIVLSDDCYSVGPTSRYDVVRIGMIPILLAARPDIAKGLGPFPGCLDGARIVMPRVPGDVFRQLHAYFTKHRVRPRVVAEVQNVEDARRLAVWGYGIAPMDVDTFRAGGPRGALTTVGPKSLKGISDSLYLVTFADRIRLNPIAKMLMKRFRLPGPRGRDPGRRCPPR